MRTGLKVVHLLGFAAFLGSVFGHIFLGRFPAPEPGQLALLMEVKHVSTGVVTMPALLLTMASGLALAWTGPGFGGWLRLKLGLAVLVMANGALLLRPIGAEIARQAALGQAIAPLAGRESLLGAVNLALALGILVIAVSRVRR